MSTIMMRMPMQLMIRWGVSHTPISKISPTVKETKVGMMVTTTEMINISEIGSTTATKTLSVITMVT